MVKKPLEKFKLTEAPRLVQWLVGKTVKPQGGEPLHEDLGDP